MSRATGDCWTLRRLDKARSIRATTPRRRKRLLTRCAAFSVDRAEGEGLMVQHALAGASIAGSIILLLLLLGLLNDLIATYSARRRFARLRALRHFWLRGKH